jgi:hypothetical protein
LVAGGELDRADAERALLAVAEECGYVTDDGQRQAWRTIQSGIAAGMCRQRTRETRNGNEAGESCKGAPAGERQIRTGGGEKNGRRVAWSGVKSNRRFSQPAREICERQVG